MIPKNKTQIKITLENNVLKELEALAENMGVTKSAVVAFLVKTF